MSKVLNNSKGQTAVEYVMLLAVAAILATTVLAKVKTFVIGDGNQQCTPTSQTLLCKIQRIIDPDGGGQFRYFYLVGHK